MKHEQPKPARRSAAPCPWCGPGTELVLRGDGLGALAVWCTACGSKGPNAKVEDGFSAADEQAIAKWSSPRSVRPVSKDLLVGLESSISLALIIGGGDLEDTNEVSVRYGDLKRLIRHVEAGE